MKKTFFFRITFLIFIGILLFSRGTISSIFSNDMVDLYIKNVQGTNENFKNKNGLISIQQAIDNASDGDTIYIWAGTYYENIIINKSLTIIGNNSVNTIIDGGGNGEVINITEDWVNITGFTIRNSGNRGKPYYDSAIQLYMANFVNIYENNCTNNTFGITSIHSNNIIIKNNTIRKNLKDIEFYNSSNNIIINNKINYYSLVSCNQNTIINNNIKYISILKSKSCNIINNTFSQKSYGDLKISESKELKIENNEMYHGLSIEGIRLEYWNTHTISTNNTINGNPIYYWMNVNSGKIPPSAGQVILVNCSNVIVEDQTLCDGYMGIELAYSKNNILRNNVCNSNLLYGIYIFNSTLNEIINNTCSFNYGQGIQAMDSDLNIINNNTCYSNDVYGIILQNSNSNILCNNSCSNNWRGMEIASSNNCLIINNTCNSNNQTGLEVQNSKSIYIENNTFNQNLLNGFRLLFSINSKINNNNLSNNFNGVFLQEANNNFFIENIISNNSNIGILMTAGHQCNNNLIYHNNIISNTQQILNNGNNVWNNSNQEGNYWSDYTGVDNGNDGRPRGDNVGDTKIPHQNVDYYPLVNPGDGSTNDSSGHKDNNGPWANFNNCRMISILFLIIMIFVLLTLIKLIGRKKPIK